VFQITPASSRVSPEHGICPRPRSLDGPRNLKDYVKKPLFGREGKGVKVVRNWVDESSAEQGIEAAAESDVYVYQKLAPLAEADGNTAVIGSWLIDGEPAGMGIRESKDLVTTNTSRFVPHLFR